MFLNILSTWLKGLLAIAALVAGIWLIAEWVDELPREEVVVDAASGARTLRPLETLGERLRAWDPEPNRSVGLLVAGGLLLLWSLGGRLVTPMLWRKRGEPAGQPSAIRVHRVKSPQGYELHVEEAGAKDAVPVLLVHGVGSDRTQWREAVGDLSDRFRVFTVDLLGHGKSAHVAEAQHTLEAAARDVDAVMALAGTEKLVLAGHSMGGMIAMTWCAMHPERESRLAGLVLVHTTPQDPYQTMEPVGLHRALKPFYAVLLRITQTLSPLVRVMNVMSWLNGSSHWENDRVMFGGDETREQLERSARLQARMDPAAVARFSLAMMRFDARRTLGDLDVPTVVVAGERDGVTRPEASRDIAKRVHGARLVTLRRTRHMGFLERREDFAEAVEGLQPEQTRKDRRAAAAR